MATDQRRPFKNSEAQIFPVNFLETTGTIGTGFVCVSACVSTRETGYRQERALVMELLHRYSGPKQRMITERCRDRRAIREKIETEPKIRKWFQDFTRLST